MELRRGPLISKMLQAGSRSCSLPAVLRVFVLHISSVFFCSNHCDLTLKAPSGIHITSAIFKTVLTVINYPFLFYVFNMSNSAQDGDALPTVVPSFPPSRATLLLLKNPYASQSLHTKVRIIRNRSPKRSALTALFVSRPTEKQAHEMVRPRAWYIVNILIIINSDGFIFTGMWYVDESISFQSEFIRFCDSAPASRYILLYSPSCFVDKNTLQYLPCLLPVEACFVASETTQPIAIIMANHYIKNPPY